MFKKIAIALIVVALALPVFLPVQKAEASTTYTKTCAWTFKDPLGIKIAKLTQKATFEWSGGYVRVKPGTSVVWTKTYYVPNVTLNKLWSSIPSGYRVSFSVSSGWQLFSPTGGNFGLTAYNTVKGSQVAKVTCSIAYH